MARQGQLEIDVGVTMWTAIGGGVPSMNKAAVFLLTSNVEEGRSMLICLI